MLDFIILLAFSIVLGSTIVVVVLYFKTLLDLGTIFVHWLSEKPKLHILHDVE